MIRQVQGWRAVAVTQHPPARFASFHPVSPEHLGVGVRVKATREGLVGGRTASGYVVDTHVPFVALPDVSALGTFVRVTNPANGKSALAVVLDVGPWNEHDRTYVFGGARPAAEQGVDTRGRATNGAGIDLGEKVWRQLGMTDNGLVDWEFIE